MNAKNKLILIIAMLLLAGGIALWQLNTRQPSNLSEAPQGGDFTLESAQGPFHLKDLRGKVVLLYFGYTNCPDICPTTLSGIAQAFKALTKADLAKVAGVFVGIDPERDTPKKLATYAKFFSPSIIGVTGTPGKLAQIAKQYGAVYRITKKTSGTGYLVSHSANTYVIAPDGSLNTILPEGTPPPKITKVIRGLLGSS